MRRSSFIFALPALALSLAASFVGTAAQAQPSVDLRTFRPTGDPRSTLVLEPSTTVGDGSFALQALGHYTYRSVSVRNAGTSEVLYRPIDHQLITDFVGTLGVGKSLQLALAIPVVLQQGGSGNLPSTVSETPAVPSTGIGDVTAMFKGTFLDNRDGGFGLAAVTQATLPSGDRASFVGEGSATFQGRILGELSLVLGGVQASAGYKLRTERRTWPAAQAGGVRFGDEIPWSFGLWFKPTPLGIDPEARQRLELALRGSLPAGPALPFGAGDPGSAALSPMMVSLGNRYELGRYRDSFATLGFDVGLTQAAGTPTFRGIVGFGYAPHDHDEDKDGVPDDVDACPGVPEDRDGFEDTDGCPDIDDDDDNIPDKEDACPREKGVISSDPKKNGCAAADQDKDGVPDDVDACPALPGVPSKDRAHNGCPTGDRDGDGIADHADKCPDQPEDKDGFQDEDGCPDPDDDGDGIPDTVDACRLIPGDASREASRNGCPNDDRDGDTIPNAVDKCPDLAETFNGVDDEDGCPDVGGTALARTDPDTKAPAGLSLRLMRPLVFEGTGTDQRLAAASVVLVRALAVELGRHPELIVAVGARPVGAGPAGSDAGLARAFAVVRTLADLSGRSGVAETVSFEAVRKSTAANANVGFLLLSGGPLPEGPKGHP
jgi:OmpA-OmpF porin, OOP family